jgi:hypothetical protein
MEEYALFEEMIIPWVAIHDCLFTQLVFGVLRTPFWVT